VHTHKAHKASPKERAKDSRVAHKAHNTKKRDAPLISSLRETPAAVQSQLRTCDPRQEAKLMSKYQSTSPLEFDRLVIPLTNTSPPPKSH